ncbi:MAG TPA: hypothetical protein VIN08_22440 [Ohtaekwangia sp.]|uniref:hypothetical protein n=1 Tax=Ohtaekwangia sp. TaxID=2066019 RepID=UPI002F93B5C9
MRGEELKHITRFDSSLIRALVNLFTSHAQIAFVLVSATYLINGFSLPSVEKNVIILASAIYLVLVYIYLGVTNHTFVFTDQTLEVENRLLFFRMRQSFPLRQIKQVLFRHDWTETAGKEIKIGIFRTAVRWTMHLFFPFDYKWIEITTTRSFRFYCFGLDYDYFDNEGPLFEDLFKALKSRGIRVGWTNKKYSPYYDGLWTSTELKAPDKNQSPKYFSKP